MTRPDSATRNVSDATLCDKPVVGSPTDSTSGSRRFRSNRMNRQ
jgi:hypothetical protein